MWDLPDSVPIAVQASPVLTYARACLTHGVAILHARILALLDEAGVPYRVHEHAPVRTIEDAFAFAPHLTTNLVKTIAFEIADSTRVVFAAVGTHAQVDYKRLAAHCGCNRRALRLLPPWRVEAELGFEVGGLGPFAIGDAHMAVIDRAVLALPYLRCGAGVRTRTLELAPADLVRATGADMADIARATTETLHEH